MILFFLKNKTNAKFNFSQEARGVYVYFLAKISELLDTVFFVLRKRDRQVTFLHLYHHTVMPMISWGTTKYYPGGHGTFIGLINSFVHIIMYAYYLLSALGPQMQKYLWWKKYITNMQMVGCIDYIKDNKFQNLNFRSSSAWHSSIKCNFSSLTVVSQGGRCASHCPTPSSSTSCSTTSTKNLTRRRRLLPPRKPLRRNFSTITMIQPPKIITKFLP